LSRPPRSSMIDKLHLPGADSRDLYHGWAVCPDGVEGSASVYVVVARSETCRHLSRAIGSESHSHTPRQHRYAFFLGVRVKRHDEAITEPEPDGEEVGTLRAAFQKGQLTT
jgi:hypothetical protein